MPETPPTDLGSLPFGFSIVGVQKSGTTTLSQMLDRHRLICAAPKKEMQFFNDEDRSWDPPDYSGYVAPKRRPQHRLAGDATPEYLFWPGALERMRAYNRDMRLIAIFRDPLDRLFSQWLMHRRRFPEDGLDWPEIIEYRPDELPDRIPPDMTPQWFRHRSAVIRGCYGSQVRHGLEVFDRSQWLFLDFASFVNDHERHLDDVTDFLGIHRYRRYPPAIHAHKQEKTVTGTAPTAQELTMLADYFAPEIALFSAQTGIDVSGWTTSRLLAGTLDPGELALKYARKAGLA